MDTSIIGTDLIFFTYRFKFSSGTEKIFKLFLDPETLEVLRTENGVAPEWAKLENFKCPHCPLQSAGHRYCPVALNLKDIINFFRNVASYEKVEIEVDTNQRKYLKKTDVQGGVSALMGILMVSSGCPILGKLKPLVRFHLPFASIDETEFRVFSMYLLAQYIQMKKGYTADWEMNNLKQIYNDIEVLNQNIVNRISSLELKDSSANSVVILNNFANAVSISLDDDQLMRIGTLFKEFMEEN